MREEYKCSPREGRKLWSQVFSNDIRKRGHRQKVAREGTEKTGESWAWDSVCQARLVTCLPVFNSKSSAVPLK